MATRINKEIKSNFKKYEALLKGYKNSSTEIVVLNQIKQRHPNQRISTTSVDHESIPEKIELIIESKIEDKRDFKFKLRAPELTGEPFFRFDSDGVSHMNGDRSIPLDERKVDTPHFHRFDEEGRNVAYKTESLKNQAEQNALINDINLFAAHFCDESNTSYNKQYIKVVQTPVNEFDFDTDVFNPTKGITYE